MKMKIFCFLFITAVAYTADCSFNSMANSKIKMMIRGFSAREVGTETVKAIRYDEEGIVTCKVNDEPNDDGRYKATFFGERRSSSSTSSTSSPCIPTMTRNYQIRNKELAENSCSKLAKTFTSLFCAGKLTWCGNKGTYSPSNNPKNWTIAQNSRRDNFKSCSILGNVIPVNTIKKF